MQEPQPWETHGDGTGEHEGTLNLPQHTKNSADIYRAMVAIDNAVARRDLEERKARLAEIRAAELARRAREKLLGTMTRTRSETPQQQNAQQGTARGPKKKGHPRHPPPGRNPPVLPLTKENPQKAKR